MRKLISLIIVITTLSLFFGCTVREIDFQKEDMGFTENRIGSVPDDGLYLAPVKFAGYWGFIDQDGNYIIEPIFKNAKPFSDGLALVMGDAGWGFIDKTGEFIIGPGLSSARSFSEGLAAVRYASGWGYIDLKGNETIPPAYASAESFSGGYAVVSSDNSKKGYIDTNGNYIIEEKYDIALSFTEGTAFVYPFHNAPEPSKRSAYIYPDGTLALQPLLKGYNYGSFSEGLAAVYKQSDFLYGYMNIDGNIVIEPRFLMALPFSEGVAAVKELGAFGFIDKSGEYVIKPDFDNAQPFTNGMAAVAYYTKKCGFIDSDGNLIIDYAFQDTRSFTKVD